jgi:hypothetical protein
MNPENSYFFLEDQLRTPLERSVPPPKKKFHIGEQNWS